MEIENKLEELDGVVVKEEEEKVIEATLDDVGAGEKEPTWKSYKWIIDKINFTKTCEACGAVMKGWAYREKFYYCPICGIKIDD